MLGISTSCDEKTTYGSIYPSFLDHKFVGHNAKYDAIVLKRHGFNVPDVYFDTMVAYYMLHIDKSKKLENIVKDLYDVHKKDLVEVYNESTGESRVTLPDTWYEKIDPTLLSKYAQEDASYTEKLYYDLSKELEKQPILNAWFHEVEMPLLNILVKMEMTGVKVDRQGLLALGNELKCEVEKLEKRIKYLAGSTDFNINSSKQVRDILFNKFELPIQGKTDKGESSVNKDTLQQLVKKCEHHFPELMLKHREYSKSLSTYTFSLVEKLDDNDRMHTSFNQALTNTRRFSSENPNLQNIPTRSEIGKKIKGCFIPEVGHKFLIADYSQLEPRILAHLSEDDFLIDCFNTGKDIYENTANIVRTSGFGEFSRDKSKILFLALMYGKSSFGLAQDWHCKEEEADEIVQAVFKELKGVRQYIDQVQERAFKTGGWLTSLAGLPLYVGDPHSNNKWEGKAVDRCAVNYPIQASSQDILKRAIVNIHDEYERVPVLMVHDELVYELPEILVRDNANAKCIIDQMEHAWDLRVPLKVEYKISERWEK